MNTRLKLLRKELKMSQDVFGARLGVTAAGISKIESGQRSLTEQMLILVCKEFHVNEQWLRYGEGEIFSGRLSSGIDQLADYYQLDEMDVRIISEYMKLDEKKRKVIKEYITRITYIKPYSDMLADGEVEKEELRCAEGPDTEEKR